jgi:type IX secretion system PorP/SprF family membrane protein
MKRKHCNNNLIIMTKRLLNLIFFLLLVNQISGQDLLIYNQYLNNPYLINPAWAGMTQFNELRAYNRQQWIGMKDAPSTQTISYQGGFNNVGLGGYLFNDVNGRTSSKGLSLTFAYHVKFMNYSDLSKPNLLSFGVSLGGNQYKIDVSSLLAESNDPVLGYGNLIATNPTLNFGTVFQKGNLFAGFSATQLLPQTVKSSNSIGEPVKPRTYFLNAGFNFEFHESYVFTPSAMIKYNENSERQFDTNFKLLYKGFFDTDLWSTLTYRREMDKSLGMNNAFAVSAGIVYKQLFLGYLFEAAATEIRLYNKGSHEIMIGYNFTRNVKKNHKNPPYRPFGGQ